MPTRSNTQNEGLCVRSSTTRRSLLAHRNVEVGARGYASGFEFLPMKSKLLRDDAVINRNQNKLFAKPGAL